MTCKSRIIEKGQETTTTSQRAAVFNPLACYQWACLNVKLRSPREGAKFNNATYPFFEVEKQHATLV